jgi:hypothetical protein
MPENKLVVIVARTHMYGGRVCVGALSDAGENLRLMNKDCASDRDRDSPFKVGEEWEITCAPCGPRRPPHVEDAFVSNATKRGNVGSLSDYILKRAAPWKGAIPAYDLHLDHDDRNKAGYYPQHDHRHLSYVGVQDAVDVITAGQLVRVSLARWWRPENADPDFEERCYAQLSGWY